ncbi:unnamed protein product [Heterobilharzia americana]|nr:unnamed protein product [Heterobilharzia americana]
MDDEFYFTQPTADVSDDNVFRQPVINQVPVLYVYSPSGEKIIEFPLVKKHVTIGRDPSCDICIKSSSFLSRKHGVFELNENYFCTITDLGSLNGIREITSS